MGSGLLPPSLWVARIAVGMTATATATAAIAPYTVFWQRRRWSPRRRTWAGSSGFTVIPPVPKFSRSWIGSRVESDMVGSGRVGAGRGQQGCKGGAAAGETGLDGSLRYADLAGDVDDREVDQVVQHQGLALLVGELAQSRDQCDPALVDRLAVPGGRKRPVGWSLGDLLAPP